MINDIKYEHHFPDSADVMIPLVIEKGSEIGKLTYKMAGSEGTLTKSLNKNNFYRGND
ncbi:hypothetical protein [Psychrobacillus sp. L4]|uniref:hypothetical protein n=1 Tax=Psychrobacillus sp. L4 TaxID=3236892 RepID=UPI0036F430E4